MDIHLMIELIANNYQAILATCGIGGASISTACSFISKYLPDTIKKETEFLGVRLGAIRGFYNPFMSLVNAIAFNSGKASNSPKAQK